MARPPVEPRPAATVILLRGGAERLEVLMVRRNPAARFMGGAWVFPGGAVDSAADAPTTAGAPSHPSDATHRHAARREVAEEAGLRLDDPAALVPFAHW